MDCSLVPPCSSLAYMECTPHSQALPHVQLHKTLVQKVRNCSIVTCVVIVELFEILISDVIAVMEAMELANKYACRREIRIDVDPKRPQTKLYFNCLQNNGQNGSVTLFTLSPMAQC